MNKKSGEWFQGDSSEVTTEDQGIYAMSDGSVIWTNIKLPNQQPFYSSWQYKYIGEIPALPKPPVELKHGHAYMFDAKDEEDIMGIYDSVDDTFDCCASFYRANDCTNIRRMEVVDD